MAYEVGSFLAELKAEHDRGEHEKELSDMCSDCMELASRLEADHLEKGKHEEKPHPLCWVCNADADHAEALASQEAAEQAGVLEEWTQNKREKNPSYRAEG